MGKSIAEKHWDYLLLFEDDLSEIFKVVEPDEGNYSCYGPKIVKLLLSVCSEIDAAFKDLALLTESGIKLSGQPNISQYHKIIDGSLREEFSKPVVIFRGTTVCRSPWKQWLEQKGSPVAPDWWRSYNNVKHGRIEHYAEGNLCNLLDAIAGLFIVDSCIYLYQQMNDECPVDIRRKLLLEFVEGHDALGSNDPLYYAGAGRLVSSVGFHRNPLNGFEKRHKKG